MGGMDTPFGTNTNHINDRSRLKNPKEIAKFILEHGPNQKEISSITFKISTVS